MDNTSSPLTAEHCQCLDTILHSSPQALATAQKCTDCGLDMTDQMNTLKAQMDTAARLKAKFFPYQS